MIKTPIRQRFVLHVSMVNGERRSMPEKRIFFDLEIDRFFALNFGLRVIWRKSLTRLSISY